MTGPMPMLTTRRLALVLVFTGLLMSGCSAFSAAPSAPPLSATPDAAALYLEAANDFNQGYCDVACGSGPLAVTDVPKIEQLLVRLSGELAQIPQAGEMGQAVENSGVPLRAVTTDAQLVIALFGMRQRLGAAADSLRSALGLPARSAGGDIDEIV